MAEKKVWNGEDFEALFLLEATKKRIRKSETKKARGWWEASEQPRGCWEWKARKVTLFQFIFHVIFHYHRFINFFFFFFLQFQPFQLRLLLSERLFFAFRLFHSSYSCTIFNLLFNQPHSSRPVLPNHPTKNWSFEGNKMSFNRRGLLMTGKVKSFSFQTFHHENPCENLWNRTRWESLCIFKQVLFIRMEIKFQL